MLCLKHTHGMCTYVHQHLHPQHRHMCVGWSVKTNNKIRIHTTLECLFFGVVLFALHKQLVTLIIFGFLIAWHHNKCSFHFHFQLLLSVSRYCLSNPKLIVFSHFIMIILLDVINCYCANEHVIDIYCIWWWSFVVAWWLC